MWKRKSDLILPVIVAIAALIWMVPSAHADTEYGKNYDKTLLATGPDGAIYKWDSHPERIVDGTDSQGKPIYANYKLYQDANIVKLETANTGSIIFKKNSCTYDLYKSGLVSGSPPIKGVAWAVKGKLSSATTWNNVTSINNAACSVAVTSGFDFVKIVGTKSNGLGTFQIVLDYSPGKGIKETMRAYNNNPAWNNHNVGFTESFIVPRVIHMGNQTYDLANYNQTILHRNWIGNNTHKLIGLTNGFFYDFGLGWSDLDSIKISWDGANAKLTMNYLYPDGIVPYQSWVEVDPTFTGTPDSEARVVGNIGGVSVNCANSFASGDANLIINKDNSGNVNGLCTAPYFNFDVSSIPDGVTVTAAQIEYDVTGVVTPTNCDVKHLGFNGAANEATYDALTQDVGSVTDIKQNDATCTTAANGKIIVFNTGGYAALIESDISGDNNVTLGFFFTNLLRDGTDRQVTIRPADAILSITYTSIPDAVTTLVATAVSTTEIDLSWSAPNLNGGTLQRYVINYTTPCGNPTTHLANGTTATSYSVSGLTVATCYSFRVSAATEGGYNASGNIANATTFAFNQANFTVGSLSFDADNDDVIPIFFERDDINNTALYLNVTYPDTWQLACDFKYKFAMTNRTYDNLAFVTIDADTIESSFQFLNVQNEIIGVYCWDENNTAHDGTYLITQNDFPLLQYVDKFQTGHYGTDGDFGSIDLIYLGVIIVSLVGLNRTNESVGAGFMIVITAAMAYFEIITIPTAAISGIGLAVMLIIITTRKD